MKYLKNDEEKRALEFILDASEIALDSKCERSRCGSIIVKDDKVIGTGFNSPAGYETNRCSVSKKDYNIKVTDKTCCIHAEQRAIMDALRNYPDEIKGSRLYFIRVDKEGKPTFAGKPYCTICSKMALDEGIKEFVLLHQEGICVYDTQEYNDISFDYD